MLKFNVEGKVKVGLTNSTEQSPWELNISEFSQDTPVFYGTRMFIIMLTRTCHLSP